MLESLGTRLLYTHWIKIRFMYSSCDALCSVGEFINTKFILKKTNLRILDTYIRICSFMNHVYFTRVTRDIIDGPWNFLAAKKRHSTIKYNLLALTPYAIQFNGYLTFIIINHLQ